MNYISQPLLETLKTMAGIANAERLSQQTKDEAELIILKLLVAVKADADDYAKAASPILQP